MRKLAQVIFDLGTSVEFVLGTLLSRPPGSEVRVSEIGIRPSGASSILVPASEWIKKEEFRYIGSPQSASNFLSLSPLKFNNAYQLAIKLNALKPKGRKPGEDDSAANKVYLGEIGQSGQFRSAFEHNRYQFVLRLSLS